ncbi:conserved hypothetical protein, partial [delta proteobacterium NaphS2]
MPSPLNPVSGHFGRFPPGNDDCKMDALNLFYMGII